MGDAARDIGPGRGALRDDQIGDVVERDDIAVFGFARLLGRHAHRQIALAVFATDRHLALHQPLRAGSGGVEEFGEFRHDIVERPAERVDLGVPDRAAPPSG